MECQLVCYPLMANMNKFYPLKLWLLSILIVAPLLLIVVSLILNSSEIKKPEDFFVVILFMLVGLVYSIPTCIVSFLFYKILARNLKSVFLIKFFLNAVVITGVFITFWIINGSEKLRFSLFYSASVIISSLLIRMKEPEKSVIETLS